MVRGRGLRLGGQFFLGATVLGACSPGLVEIPPEGRDPHEGQSNGKAGARLVPLTDTEQSGAVDEHAARLPKVRVLGPANVPLVEVPVFFALKGGEGTIAPAETVTDAAGEAQLTSWYLGTVAGTQVVTVTVDHPRLAGHSLAFEVDVQPGEPVALVLPPGIDQQTAPVGSPLSIPVGARVEDLFGNPVPGVEVSVEVSEGGGTIPGEVVISDAEGIAWAHPWVMGTTPGAQTVRFTWGGMEVTIHADAHPGPCEDAVLVGDQQVTYPSGELPIPPSVVFRDAYGNPVGPGRTVTFTVTSGGGSVTESSVITNLAGEASSGGWTLGDAFGEQHLTATCENVQAEFTAEGRSQFVIDLLYQTSVSNAVRDAFESAAQRWQSVVVSPVGPGTVPTYAATCDYESGGSRVVNSVSIYVEVRNVDGQGGILGSAAPCYIFADRHPISGIMEFDAEDLAGFDPATMQTVILHEMGHVLGVGTLWELAGLVDNPSLDLGAGANTTFNGAEAVAAFSLVGGATYGGTPVPVANLAQEGSDDSHWRESIFGDELMSPFVSPQDLSNPLSVVTIASLLDLGSSYVVLPSQADPYLIVSARPPPPSPPPSPLPGGAPGGPPDDSLGRCETTRVDTEWLPDDGVFRVLPRLR